MIDLSKSVRSHAQVRSGPVRSSIQDRSRSRDRQNIHPRVKLIRKSSRHALTSGSSATTGMFEEMLALPLQAARPSKGRCRTPSESKKIVTTSCQILCRTVALYVLPVKNLLQIIYWIFYWNYKFIYWWFDPA